MKLDKYGFWESIDINIEQATAMEKGSISTMIASKKFSLDSQSALRRSQLNLFRNKFEKPIKSNSDKLFRRFFALIAITLIV